MTPWGNCKICKEPLHGDPNEIMLCDICIQEKISIDFMKIREAIHHGLKSVHELLLSKENPHDMEHEMYRLIADQFSTMDIYHDLVPAGVAIMHFSKQSEVEKSFERNHIPPAMARILCDPILKELRKLPGVDDYVKMVFAELEKQNA